MADYPHGVIEDALPGSGEKLPADWALQHPGDWVSSIEKAVPQALAAAGVREGGDRRDRGRLHLLHGPARGRRRARPLCLSPAWAARPHAWVKLWKHHASQPQADRINALAGEARRGVPRATTAGKTSSEWLAAKALQILDEDPEVYAAAAAIVEGGDWIVGELCGRARAELLRRGLQGLLEPRARVSVPGVLRRARSALRGSRVEAHAARSFRRAGASAD